MRKNVVIVDWATERVGTCTKFVFLRNWAATEGGPYIGICRGRPPWRPGFAPFKGTGSGMAHSTITARKSSIHNNCVINVLS